MRPYWGTIKGTIIARIIYRFGFFFTLLGNLLYMTLTFFLWKTIYLGSDTIRGMTFNQTFIYLGLAGSLFVIFSLGTETLVSNRIIDGSLIIDLIKPVDYQYLTLSRAAGWAIFNFMLITIPSLIILFLVFQAEMKFGIGLIFFPLGLVMAFLISFAIDFTIGLTSFYTESLWGINITKGVIISLLSGALIPLQFFPDSIQTILQFLPFQAIYNLPITMVTTPNLDVLFYFRSLAIQLAWVVLLFALSRWFYTRAFKVISISGG